MRMMHRSVTSYAGRIAGSTKKRVIYDEESTLRKSLPKSLAWAYALILDTEMKTRKILPNVGNWKASASIKPGFTIGASHGLIPALGYIRVGDIVEFTAIRSREAREDVMYREIAGTREAVLP